jgi:osmotically-inducible protein OsmY
MRHATVLAATVIMSWTLAGGALAVDSEHAAARPTDSEITRTVEAELAADRITQDSDIRVETENGVVALYGAVNTAGEKDKAGRYAQIVPGVVDVRNELAVRI